MLTGRTLADYNIQKESTLHLVSRLRDGAKKHKKKTPSCSSWWSTTMPAASNQHHQFRRADSLCPPPNRRRLGFLTQEQQRIGKNRNRQPGFTTANRREETLKSGRPTEKPEAGKKLPKDAGAGGDKKKKAEKKPTIIPSSAPEIRPHSTMAASSLAASKPLNIRTPPLHALICHRRASAAA